ncbi:MAG TPA: hypothetical protein EYH48_05205 [Aquifex aeolicus]|uniref:Phosphate-selective porin O and P n=1 Tax=Aquifex aeolicus TaxID=63363 RepID=A0A9D1CFE5_AQUAO|nr:hypothetical protein [Aquificales bacterium]HIP98351.1 hypothetical protein [Aquifex aeolicus]HIQ26707.1 hypothetical protein [Aquifex aeolicus]
MGKIAKQLFFGLLAGAALFTPPQISLADDYEELVNLLEEKNLLTPEEAEALIKKHREKLAKGSLLDKSEIKRLKKLVQLKIGGKAYLHYDYTINSPETEKDDKGEFKVTRAYLEVRKYFGKGKDNYFRTTVDVHQSDDGSYVVRLKYAYLNWKINNFLATEIGMVHRPWIDWEQHNGWLHRDVEKTFIEDRDGAKLLGSADVGITLKGKANNFGYMFGIYNGEGYHGKEDDKHFGKSVEGRINYTFGRLTAALHMAYMDNQNKADRFIVQPWIGFKNEDFLVAFQYIYNKENNQNAPDYVNTGFSVNGDLHLKRFIGQPLTLFARYGYWNFDKDAEDKTDYTKVDRWQVLLGAAYAWNKYIRTSLAYKHVGYDIPAKNTENGKDYKNTIMAVVQVKW